MSSINIEKCLKKIDNRFVLVIISVLRTKQLLHGKVSYINQEKYNEQIISLSEIAKGKIFLVQTKKD